MGTSICHHILELRVVLVILVPVVFLLVVVGGNGSTAGCDDDDEDGDEEDDDEEEDDGDHSKFENMVANGCGEMLMGSLGSGGMDGKKRRKRKKTGDAPPGKTPIQEEVCIEYTRQRN